MIFVNYKYLKYEEKYSLRGEQEDDSDRPLKAIIVGAGQRANVYSNYAKKHPEQLKVFC